MQEPNNKKNVHAHLPQAQLAIEISPQRGGDGTQRGEIRSEPRE